MGVGKYSWRGCRSVDRLWMFMYRIAIEKRGGVGLEDCAELAEARAGRMCGL